MPEPRQNKENRGLIEKLSSLANFHAQTMDKLQGLEVQLVKSTNQKASVEAREKKTKEDASLVSLEVDARNPWLQIVSTVWAF